MITEAEPTRHAVLLTMFPAQSRPPVRILSTYDNTDPSKQASTPHHQIVLGSWSPSSPVISNSTLFEMAHNLNIPVQRSDVDG